MKIYTMILVARKGNQQKFTTGTYLCDSPEAAYEWGMTQLKELYPGHAYRVESLGFIPDELVKEAASYLEVEHNSH